MAIPNQLNFKSEAEFTQNFVMPLLSRLGFATVQHFHGTREFGKDLVLGEIDRLQQVRYHGVQVKYVASVGLADADSLIQDARQAFANTFTHPMTGAAERISSFYAINGGTISDNARQHFFNSLVPGFGANVILIDGIALLGLDRSAALNRLDVVIPRINGMLLEMQYNSSVMKNIVMQCQRFLANEPADVPPGGLYSAATDRYLEEPFMTTLIPVGYVHAYRDWINRVNAALQFVNAPLSSQVNRNVNASLVAGFESYGETYASGVRKALLEVARAVGPISGM